MMQIKFNQILLVLFLLSVQTSMAARGNIFSSRTQNNMDNHHVVKDKPVGYKAAIYKKNLRKSKDRQRKQPLTYSQAAKVGVVSALLAGSVFVYGYMAFMDAKRRASGA